MNKVHFQAGDDEDDMYEGFNDTDPMFNTAAHDTGFQTALRTSQGRRPSVTTSAGSKFPAGGMPPKTAGRSAMPMGSGGDGTGARPMTAVRAAGFTTASGAFGGGDRFRDRGPAPPLEVKVDDSPEGRIRQMEKKVNKLIEESCIAASQGDRQLALEKAKQAGQQERVLVRQREALDIGDQINLDLTYSVLFNLANQYAANDMHQEALNAYQVLVKDKTYTQSGRLKVNMGNIYFQQRNYSRAVKMYQMALDQVPNTHKSMRVKIMQNIGISLVKLNRYADAIDNFEHIMQEEPDAKTGFNLILCHYAMGNKQKMKYAFEKLLVVDLKLDDEDRYLSHQDNKQYDLVLEVIRNDELRKYEKEKKAQAERCIKMAAKIISTAIESDFQTGYEWCIERVKMSMYSDLAHDLEIDKAIMFLKKRDFNQAIDTLKSFERKDTRVACTAATNLSFLYFLEGELGQADKYAEQALANDRYSPAALVNKANVLFQQKDYGRAREFYREAIQNDSSSVEALFNLGLVNKRLNRYGEALECFLKLHNILRNNGPVIYQIANIHELMDSKNQAMEWYMQLHGIISTDPWLLQKLGEMHEEEGDKSQAFSYYYDSFKYFPANLEVIEWLGAYYIESQFCEKAIAYFERAALMQPGQVKWQLMIASCHRRSGNYQHALEVYKSINRRFPENIECLQFLVRLCTDMGLKEAQDYANKLKKAERQKEVRDQRQLSGQGRRGSLARQQSHDSPGASRDNSAHPGAGRGGKGGIPRGPLNLDDDNGENMFQHSGPQPVGNVTYSDPLGPGVERPRTAARSRPLHEEFADEELDDNLLPE